MILDYYQITLHVHVHSFSFPKHLFKHHHYKATCMVAKGKSIALEDIM